MRGVALGLVLLCGACGESARQPATSGARPSGTGGPVVARVNGEVIGLDEVRAVCVASGLAPEVALQRLVDERLLAQYAEKRGYGELAATQQEVARARVRALLEQGVETRAPDDEGRRKETARLLGELRDKTKVVYDEDAVRRTLSDDGTPDPGS
ncbi:MAG: hypothetical protein QM778_07620 [Myxococcales bacterium]